MQQKLFLESLEHIEKYFNVIDEDYDKDRSLVSISKDNLGLYILSLQFQAFSYAYIGTTANEKTSDTELDTYKIVSFLSTRTSPDLAKLVLDSLQQDDVVLRSCLSYWLYKESKEKRNYIVSSNLTKCLSKIKMDIPVKALPKDDVRFYFQFNNLFDDESNLVKGCFCCFNTDENNKRYIILSAIAEIKDERCTYYTQESASIYLLDKYDTLETLFKNEFIPTDYTKINGGMTCTNGDESLFKTTTIRTILNAMLYVTNPNEEFKEEFNIFAKKESKLKVQKNIYTSKKFTKIGYGEDTEFLKLLVTKVTDVAPYWKNQPYGPQRSLRKYILCSGYERKQKSYFEKNDEK